MILYSKMGLFEKALKILLRKYKKNNYLKKITEKKLLRDLKRLKEYFKGAINSQVESIIDLKELVLNVFKEVSKHFDYSI